MAYLPLLGVAAVIALGVESILWSRRPPPGMNTAVMKRGMLRSVLRAFVLSGLLAWAGSGSVVLRWPFWVLAGLALLPGLVGVVPLVLMSRGDERFRMDEVALNPKEQALQSEMQKKLQRGGVHASLFLFVLSAVWALDLLVLSA